MKTNQFVKEIKNLFSPAGLYEIDHERPEIIASKTLNRKFKCLLKGLFPEAEIIDFKGGCCQSSGYIKKGDKYIYVSLSDVRFSPNWDQDVLIRTAKDEKDYTGGPNHRSSIETLQEDVRSLWEYME